MGKQPDLSDYVEVAERMESFFEKHPEGSFDADTSFAQVDGRWWAVAKVSAYRDREDPHPGVGWAYEVIPGKTPYTKDSELQNAHTAAIGRAILAVGAAKARKIASYEEVRNRTAEPLKPAPEDNAEGRAELRTLCEENSWPPAAVSTVFKQRFGVPAAWGTDEDLKAFVALVKSGGVTIEIQSEG